MCKAKVPNEILGVMGRGRITALERPDGGTSEALLWVRSSAELPPAQSHTAQAELATAPHQYALKTKAGCETVAHIVQVLTKLDENATVVSVDGIGVFYLISRNSMMRGFLRHMVDGEKMLPFVRAFHGKPSSYWWEDDVGDVLAIQQGRRGAGRSFDAHYVLFGTACSFAISEERVARGGTVVGVPRRSVCRLQAGKGCQSSQDPLKQIVGARPHPTPRGKDEGVEQEWRGARRLSRSSRSISVGHSRTCRVERRQEFADLLAGVQGPRHSVWPPGFPQQFLETEDRESPDPS